MEPIIIDLQLSLLKIKPLGFIYIHFISEVAYYFPFLLHFIICLWKFSITQKMSILPSHPTLKSIVHSKSTMLLFRESSC